MKAKDILRVDNKTTFSSPTNQSAGILDDFAVRKDIQSISGKIEKAPSEDNDIANKKYVDDEISSIPAPDLTPYWKSNGTSTATGNWDLGTRNLTTTGTIYNKASNSKHYFGASNQASIYYTGSNLWIDPDEGGSGTLYVGSTLNIPSGDLNVLSGTFTATGGTPILTRVSSGSGQLAGLQVGLDTNSSAAGTGPSFLFFADDSAGNKEYQGRLGAAWINGTNGAEEGKVLISVRANSGDTTAVTQVAQFTKDGWDNLQDNYKMTFGIAKDASIYYDGADMIISPDDVGSGDVLIGATANKTIDAGAYKVGGTAGISATINTAPLTGGGAAGTMTFVNGILTAQTQAT